MKHIVFGLSLFVVFAMQSCASENATPTSLPTVPVPADFHVAFEWGNRGMNPYGGSAYSLEIDAAGNVSYTDWNKVLEQGALKLKLTPQQVQELIAAIDSADFWSLKYDYIHCCDAPSYTIDITYGGEHHTVVHSGTLNCDGVMDLAPMALCELERKIETMMVVTLRVTPAP